MIEHPKLKKFNNMYYNLRHGMRNEIVAIVDNESLTFKNVHKELLKNTKRGHDALNNMLLMNII